MKKSALYIAVLLLMLVALASAVRFRELPLEVNTRDGRVSGQYNGGARQYLGIPYAKAPVGDLRFAAPQPADRRPHGSVLQTTQWAPFCVQAGLRAGEVMDEDCLYLNVFTPRYVKNSRPLPVMVYLHGGRLIQGDTKMFSAEVLAEQGDVVVVTIAYRLNVFGFLTLNSLAENGHLNNGLLDQQLALRWIRQNIRNFGGDPNKVFLFGESGGASATLFHMLMPESYNLYDSVGLLSVWGWVYPTTQQTIAAAYGVADKVGCNGTESEVLACLRNQTATAILPTVANSHLFVPSVGNRMIKDQPLPLLRKGDFNRRVPIMMGFTKQEGWFLALSRGGWVPPSTGITEARYMSQVDIALRILHTPTQVADAINWYEPVRQAEGNWVGLAIILEDYYIKCGTRAAAYYFYQHSRESLYAFEWDYTSANYPDQFLGAAHGNELPYIFGRNIYTPYEFTEDDHTLTRRMISSFSTMAYTGSPRDEETPWNEWCPRDPQAFLWEQPSSAFPYTDIEMTEMCQNWLPVFDPAHY